MRVACVRTDGRDDGVRMAERVNVGNRLGEGGCCQGCASLPRACSRTSASLLQSRWELTTLREA
eukprot:1886207-Rhodomonas_salina.2